MCSFFGVLVVKESLDEHASASFIDEHVVRVDVAFDFPNYAAVQ